jgi:acyl-CoA thioester hydrolase
MAGRENGGMSLATTSLAPARARAQPLPRNAFAHWQRLPTRFGDNDQYGHVNNVVYYSYFDTVVNAWLMHQGLLAPKAAVLGLVVHTECDFFSPLAFPQELEVGLRLLRLGASSMHYQLGVFAHNAAVASAVGHFVHVADFSP